MTTQEAAGRSAARKARTRKRALFLIVGLLVVVAIIVIVNRKFSHSGAVNVYAAEVKTTTIRATVSGPGRVVPEKQVKISSGVMGRIVDLAVREGQEVSEGDLLVQVDSTQYAARVREVEGSLRAVKSNVALQESRLARLEMELARQRDLRSSRLVSEKDIQAIETDVKVAKAEMASARHRVSETEACLASTRDDLMKTTIVSPLSGVVSSLDVEEGEIAIVGTMNYSGTVLMTISDLSQMEVDAEIDETDVLDVAMGQRSEVYVDALGDSALDGTVVEIASSAHTKGAGTVEEATNFRVRVRIGGEGGTLRPGMSASVEIETGVHENVRAVPIQAVLKRRASDLAKADGGGAKKPDGEAAAEETEIEGVFVVKDDKVQFRPIETGISDETDIEVVAGLEEGERVVTGPYKILARLKNDGRVRIVEEDNERADRD